MSLSNRSILWRGIYRRGHEACRLYELNSDWCLEGTAAFATDNHPCALSYSVVCDSSWRTLKGSVSGWLGDERVNIEVAVDELSQWRLNGEAQPQVDGCVDLDLNFSPSTNLLPIRRLDLGVGQQAEVKAAWLRFPSFKLEPLSQIYTRLDQTTYRYSSDGGRFVADLTVNEAGFVTDYPQIWTMDYQG